MQTNGSLSPEQFAALQSTFLVLHAVAHAPEARITTPTDAEVTETIKNLSRYSIDRLLEAFAELAEWRALGDGGVQ